MLFALSKYMMYINCSVYKDKLYLFKIYWQGKKKGKHVVLLLHIEVDLSSKKEIGWEEIWLLLLEEKEGRVQNLKYLSANDARDGVAGERLKAVYISDSLGINGRCKGIHILPYEHSSSLFFLLASVKLHL